MTAHQLSLRVTVIGGDRLANDYAVPIPSWGNGSATSLEQAKREFQAAWQRFYASLTPDDIAYWHQLQDAAAGRRSK